MGTSNIILSCLVRPYDPSHLYMYLYIFLIGLTLFALNFFATGQDIYGAICFVLSLGFKQMSLYYAPAIGSYLLAKCWYLGPDRG